MPTVTLLSGNVAHIDLESRDFESYRDSVLGTDGLADLYLPNWSDRSELDLGVALTEVFAFYGDNLSYYQDRCANEALPLTCVERRSVIEHSRWIGYELRPIQAASVELDIVTNGAGTMQAGSKILVDTSDGSDQATFELYEDFVPTGAGTYTGVIAVHGESRQDTPQSSTGAPGQLFELQASPMALGPDGTPSLDVWVSEAGPAEIWVLVPNFLESSATDKVYRIFTDENDTTTVQFGDGVKGKIPESGVGNLQFNYRVGGGVSGNQVGPNKLTRFPQQFQFIDTVTNPERPSGGKEKESIEEAKVSAPASLISMERAVRHDDFAIQAKKVSGVASANATRDARIPLVEIVTVAAYGENPVPTGTWDRWAQTGTGTLGNVGGHLLSVCVTPIILDIRPCRPIRMNVAFEIYFIKTIRIDDGISAAQLTIRNFFSSESQEIGIQCPVSGLVKELESTFGVDYLNVLRFQRTPLERRLSGQYSDITFDMSGYGPETLPDRWTVRFLTTSTFEVDGDRNGLQVNTGSLDSVYTTDDGGFSFTILGGSIPPMVSEKWEIVTGAYVGNADPDYDEMCLLHEGADIPITPRVTQ